MPDSKREKTKLDIQSHSNSDLLRLISQQMLEGDYTYSSLWISIVNLSKHTPDTKESRQIQALINDLIERCEDRIEEDDSHAMTVRGMMHHFGAGEPVDYNKAIALYDNAIKLDNNTTAMNNRAMMHEKGQGGPVNYREAIRLYEMAINLGDARAMNNRAWMHKNGQGGPVNYQEAIRLYEMAINLGDARAMNTRARMHKNGQGGPVNYQEAIRLYEMAIKLGDTRAMNNRAWMHQQGQGGPVNYQEAIRLYEMAIKLGYATAMNNRAWMHKNGQGGPVNYQEAIRLYEMAIKLGDDQAMSDRAWMHLHGQGGPVNYQEAIRLYEMAIKLGYATAMNNRAWMHENGQGGPVNYPEAIRLFEMANRLEISSAKSNLNNIFRLKLVNNADTAHELLDVIWDDLLAGLSFTEHTLTLLGTHCKKEILARLTDKESKPGTNLKFISQLITNHDHPLTKILDHGKSLKSYIQYLVRRAKTMLLGGRHEKYHTEELKSLSTHGKFLLNQRMTFFKGVREDEGSVLSTLPEEVAEHLLSFVHPGGKV
ncbi:SEL1-like repeat protein [Legionella spiritensis]|uniref:SEL1-like repeat protein n=1 Tax=Legionella spiritensis TaxID=452 RepID=UPI000F71FAA0|nr:SEL1-like repeat protein [Legionella spiritensis]VEG91154.1 TPR repeat protein [Legionella spiritensis]